MGLSLVPSVIRKDPEWNQTVMTMVALYKADLPSPHNIDTEPLSWQRKWENYADDDLPKRTQDALTTENELFFLNIRTLMIITCTIPVTTSCKRSISTFRRVKIWLRSTITQERQKGLLLISIHHGIDVDCQVIVDSFYRRHPWRMKLTNILDSDNKL